MKHFFLFVFLSEGVELQNMQLWLSSQLIKEALGQIFIQKIPDIYHLDLTMHDLIRSHFFKYV